LLLAVLLSLSERVPDDDAICKEYQTRVHLGRWTRATSSASERRYLANPATRLIMDAMITAPKR
jgi:hypothetical protein